MYGYHFNLNVHPIIVSCLVPNDPIPVHCFPPWKGLSSVVSVSDGPSVSNR